MIIQINWLDSEHKLMQYEIWVKTTAAVFIEACMLGYQCKYCNQGVIPCQGYCHIISELGHKCTDKIHDAFFLCEQQEQEGVLQCQTLTILEYKTVI